ncbi:MAG: hypothetical protein IPJ98_28575 [Bryobacterales bacterium]|nr:hypothetical protein [Bryobacterales bacterium]
MTCPFLSETRVRGCSAASCRKLLASPLVSATGERCGTLRHAECSVFQERGGSLEGGCPYLEDRLVQFCTAVPVPRYVPYSSPEVTPCGSEAFRYCEAYLAMAGAYHRGEEVAEGVAAVETLHYATNHMWLDIGGGGLCHVGIDQLLARFLGRVEHATLLTQRGVGKPTVVLTIQGVDWPLTFPKPLLMESADVRLRSNPAPITADPYGAGWLFSGWMPPGVSHEEMCRDLLHGRRAVAWMRLEAERLSEILGGALAPPVAGVAVAADGGSVAEGAAAHLMRDQLLGVLNRFFPSHVERAWE